MELRLNRLFATLGIVVLCSASASAAGAVDKDIPLVMGYSNQVFYNVDPRDAIGLIRSWVRMVDHKIGSKSETVAINYKTPLDMEDALAKDKVDILVMLPEEFIHLKEQYKLAPVLSVDYGKQFYNELILIVRSDVGISKIEQLRGKNLILDVGQKGFVPYQWLDSFMRKKVSSGVKSFFGTVSESAKASQAVMPVFFRKADACVVSRSSYETMVELNPQFGRQLLVLESSPGFLSGVVAVRKDVHNSKRDAVQKAFQEMNTEQNGRQILMMFRVNRLVPFLPEHLVAIEKVIKEHQGETILAARRSK